MASISTLYVRFWFLTVDDDVHDVGGEDVSLWIAAVLDDDRGWKRFGYRFEQITPEDGKWARQQPGAQKYVFHIHVSTDDTIKNECGFGGLSCADMHNNTIYINCNRWLHGSKESGLSIEDYRVYVIQHEIGHLLSRKHYDCSRNGDEMCPVMYQQTISKGCCLPNPWPLDWE